MPDAIFGVTPKKPPKKKSYLELRLEAFIGSRGLPPAVQQFRFHPTRKWQFDFAWPALGVALEIEGAVFVQGRHSRGLGLAEDCEKYNAAAALGWIVYRVTTQQFRDNSVFDLVREIVKARPTYRATVLVDQGE